MPQAPGMPTAAAAWQGNPQAPSMFAGNVGAPTLPDGQMTSWNPSMQGMRPGFPPAPGTYPGQAYVPLSSMPMYPTSGGPPPASADSFQSSSQQMSLGSMSLGSSAVCWDSAKYTPCWFFSSCRSAANVLLVMG